MEPVFSSDGYMKSTCTDNTTCHITRIKDAFDLVPHHGCFADPKPLYEPSLLDTPVPALPTPTLRPGHGVDPPDTCSICYEQLASCKVTGLMACSHRFHTDCLEEWIASSWELSTYTCPMCRAAFCAARDVQLDAFGNELLKTVSFHAEALSIVHAEWTGWELVDDSLCQEFMNGLRLKLERDQTRIQDESFWQAMLWVMHRTEKEYKDEAKRK